MSIDAFKLSYEISPIILTGGSGIAGLIPGGLVPIVAITEAANFTSGLLGGGGDKKLDDFFAHFYPMSGGSLIDYTAATYTFANQQTAANAVIANGTRLTMRMTCPARGIGGWAVKLATMTALVATLKDHINGGGTFSVATPSFVYTDGLLLTMRDISSPASHQPQSEWALDFFFPLLTEAQAIQAQNTEMSKITSGVQTDGATSGFAPTIGSVPSIAGPSIIPAASNLQGASLSGAAGFGSFGGTSVL